MLYKEIVDARTDARTDGRRTTDAGHWRITKAHLSTSCSGELKTNQTEIVIFIMLTSAKTNAKSTQDKHTGSQLTCWTWPCVTSSSWARRWVRYHPLHVASARSRQAPARSVSTTVRTGPPVSPGNQSCPLGNVNITSNYDCSIGLWPLVTKKLVDLTSWNLSDQNVHSRWKSNKLFAQSFL